MLAMTRTPVARARHDLSRPGCASAARAQLGGAGRQYQPVALPERPRRAHGRAVAVLDVAQAPRDLRGRVGAPVGAGRGHLRAGQRLRDAVGAARRGCRRRRVPVALARPERVEAAELVRAPAEVAEHRRGRRARVRGGSAASAVRAWRGRRVSGCGARGCAACAALARRPAGPRDLRRGRRRGCGRSAWRWRRGGPARPGAAARCEPAFAAWPGTARSSTEARCSSADCATASALTVKERGRPCPGAGEAGRGARRSRRSRRWSSRADDEARR